MKSTGIAGTIAMLMAATLSSASVAAQSGATQVKLSAGGGAPGAGGSAAIALIRGAAVGTVQVHNLPSQPFGSGRFYGVWYVRSDDSKAFLGALISKDSIIFSTGGNGTMRFGATQFTTGPAAGQPLTFGPPGTNVLVVLIENVINGLTPAPVGPVPGIGVAVIGTF
jgi:hypothetical protein